DLIRPAVEEAARTARALCDEAAWHGQPVDTVLLVGGSARIPLVQRLLKEALPLEPQRWSNQDVAVALGAAYFANLKWGSPAAGQKTRARVEATTTLSDLIHRLAERESDEKKRMSTEQERQRQETRKRVLDVFSTRAAAIEAEYQRLRKLLAQ